MHDWNLPEIGGTFDFVARRSSLVSRLFTGNFWHNVMMAMKIDNLISMFPPRIHKILTAITARDNSPKQVLTNYTKSYHHQNDTWRTYWNQSKRHFFPKISMTNPWSIGTSNRMTNPNGKRLNRKKNRVFWETRERSLRIPRPTTDTCQNRGTMPVAPVAIPYTPSSTSLNRVVAGPPLEIL
jgi:hypothetical protein